MSGLSAAFSVTRLDGFRVDVDLSIAPGETLALLGPNGAGKSTAVAAIAGLIPIDDGTVELNGVVLDDPRDGVHVPPEGRGIGVVFQDYLLFPHLDALENVAFGLRSRGMTPGRARQSAGAWLEKVGLTGLAGRRPGDLSGGERQRVALARALAIEPDALLLDEPLSALDVATRATVRRDLQRHLTSFAGPRLLITHDPFEAFQLADRIAIMEEGTITQTGDHNDIRLRPRTRYAAELGGTNFLVGTADSGRARVGTGTLTIADRDVEGDVMLTIHPTAISVHRSRPEGSPRNSWRAPISHLESLGDTVRLLVGGPLPLTAEITTASVDELTLTPGEEVWLSVKATEIHVEPVSGS